MKQDAVIKALSYQLEKIIAVQGGTIRQTDHEGAFIGNHFHIPAPVVFT